MRQFGSLAAFGEYLIRAASEIEHVEHHAAEEAADHLVEYAKGLIGQEHDFWPPLAESTVARKTQLGFVNRISATDPLYRTGLMRDSIEGRVQEHLAGTAIDITVGSDSDTAVYQELGTERNLPPRPFLSTTIMHRGEAAAHEIMRKMMKVLTG